MPRRAFIASIMKVTGNVNADIGVGTRIPLKKILTWNQEVKAFVSARCIRRCIRERLFEKKLPIDPLTLVGKAEEQLGDIGDPVQYVDDDIFGFLVPTEPPRKRSSAIKISHLISLRHTEIKPEFGGRFERDFLPQYQEGYPAPFEVEVAEWVGRMGVIVSENVGRFEEAELELTDEQKSSLTKGKDGYWYLPQEERKKRLKAFLEILLYEGWQFPRGSQSPSIPEFWYSVIVLTQHFTPLFGYVEVDEKGDLSSQRLNDFVNLYKPLVDKIVVLDYRKSQYQEGIKSPPQKLADERINQLVAEICDYLIR